MRRLRRALGTSPPASRPPAAPAFLRPSHAPSPPPPPFPQHSKAAQFYRDLPSTLNLAPGALKAILVVSAHWEEPTVTVQTHPSPPLFFDYYGFPPEAYTLEWGARGSPAVASRAAALLAAAGIKTAQDAKRGYDHGAFVPLKVAFPGAEVPVVQLSLHRSLDPELHARIGRALAPLRNEGVLIIGSGSTTHNLGAMGSPGMKPVPWAAEFQAWLDDVLVGSKGGQGASSSSSSSSSPPPPTSSSERLARLLKFEAEAPHFRKAHPREEHFIPIVVAAAAGFADVAPPSSSSTSSGAAEAEAVVVADGEAVATAAAEVAPQQQQQQQQQQQRQQQQHAATKLFSAFALGTLSLASYRFD